MREHMDERTSGHGEEHTSGHMRERLRDHLRGLELTTRLLKARVAWRHPLYLVHALTARCNARCGFCAWNPDFYDPRDQLTTPQIEALYTSARRAGFVGVSMWGGEPLLHRDFERVSAHAKGLGLETHLVTNGFLLEKKLDAVASHVDRVCVSLDYASPRHDEVRRIPGLFDAIVRGVRALRARAPDKPILFVCTLMRDNVDARSLRALAELCEELSVLGVWNALREDAATSDGPDLREFSPEAGLLREAFVELSRLKRRGYPILNSNTHLDMLAAGPPVYRCHWPKLMLPIEANGDVVDCMHWGTRPVGNVRDTPFEELLASPRLRALAGREGEACHRCVSLHRVEVSEVWEGNLEPLRSWRMLARRPHAASPG
jgi:MoaA/NifB/PqqE/SkfB family radical SAM enzyme